VARDALHQRGELGSAGLVPDLQEPAEDPLGELLGITREGAREDGGGVGRQVQRRDEQGFLAAEPVVDHRRVHPGAFGDRPHRGAVVAAFGEHRPGGDEQLRPGVAAAGSASAAAGRAGVVGYGHVSIFPLVT
jgi:hypothetical protein